jgi:hypothetical protein
MDYEFKTIIEKLAILEGRIDPKESKPVDSKQKKPALFTNLKKDESAIPMVGGVEFAEDILGKVRASLDDYLKSAEEKIKQDKELISKKKQDSDIKKKDIKNSSLHTKHQDIKHDNDQDEYSLEEDPNQTPASGEAPAGMTDPTYSQGSNNTYAESAPVKTLDIPCEEVGLSGGGGSVLVELHGNMREGFCIKRAGRALPTKFKTLDEAEMALEMYRAHCRSKLANDEGADYLEEK